MNERTKEVMGIQSESNSDWQTRAKLMCDPNEWSIEIQPSDQLLDLLSADELRRMHTKVHLVMDFAQRMLAGMVKGTIKYPTDDYTFERWMSHLVSEQADQANYTILLEHAHQKKSNS